MKRWLPWLGLGVSVLCALYFVRVVMRHWSSLADLSWGGATFATVLAAMALYGLTYAFAARAWQLELRGVGFDRRYGVLARIILTAQFAKYLPGNIGHHVGRVVLGKRAGLPTDAILLSMLVDTLLVVLAGVAGSLSAWPLLVRVVEARGSGAMQPLAIAASAFLVAAVVALAMPTLRRRLLALRDHGAMDLSLRIRWFGQAWICQYLCFLLGASALYLLFGIVSDALCVASMQQWLAIVGIYSAAWLLGFLMPGAPAGLGVRELVLLLGLSPLIGEQPAVTASLVLRLATTLSDGVLFASVIAGKRPGMQETT